MTRPRWCRLWQSTMRSAAFCQLVQSAASFAGNIQQLLIVMRFRLIARSRIKLGKTMDVDFLRSADTRFMRQRMRRTLYQKREPGSVRLPWRWTGKECTSGNRRNCQRLCDGTVRPASSCRNGKKIIKELPKSATHFWKD